MPLSTAVLVAVLVLMLIGFAALKKRSRAADPGWPVFATPVLSQAEQVMYHRLVKVFPEYLVLPQVSLAQFINVRKGATFHSVFNRYNRLTADFVICQRISKSCPSWNSTIARMIGRRDWMPTSESQGFYTQPESPCTG